jgi:hypothetical protein
MAFSNQECVAKAMELPRAGRAPFVEREVHAAVKARSVRMDTVRRFANHLKHGMMTVRRASAPADGPTCDHGDQPATNDGPPERHHMSMGAGQTPRPPVSLMTLLSFLALAAGVAIAFLW